MTSFHRLILNVAAVAALIAASYVKQEYAEVAAAPGIESAAPAAIVDGAATSSYIVVASNI